MATHWVMLTISLLGIIHGYDTICKRVTCTVKRSSVREGLTADKVTDGNTKQDYHSCIHVYTARIATSEAWVMVDLQKEYKLQNIIIYYKNEIDDLNVVKKNVSRVVWNSRRQYRFRKYSLEVSNSSDAEQWEECYKANTSDSSIPLSILNISCKRTARYLRIITNYDAPEDDAFSEKAPIPKVCEIQIYGSDIGCYGPNRSRCEDCEHCDTETGCRNNEASEKNEITKVHSVLYGVVTFLILSIFVNTFFIAWKVKEKIDIRRASTNEHGPYNSIRDANRDVYDRIEDIANYQELGQLSQPSQYEGLNK